MNRELAVYLHLQAVLAVAFNFLINGLIYRAQKRVCHNTGRFCDLRGTLRRQVRGRVNCA
jgi:uncharacterized membrane protein YjgN (DUF898 family)